MPKQKQKTKTNEFRYKITANSSTVTLGLEDMLNHIAILKYFSIPFDIEVLDLKSRTIGGYLRERLKLR